MEKDSLDKVHFSLTHQQLSYTVAALLALSFFIFIGGYFLGKQKAAEEFSYKADQDSLADHIYSSMCILYDAKDENDDGEENEGDAEILENSEEPEKKEEISAPSENQAAISDPNVKKYFAALAGFSSATLAEGKKMLNRLKAQGFEVQIVERTSKTAKGQSKIWHQLITNGHPDKNDLQKVVSQIAKLEHIKEKNIIIQEMRQV